jgi:hypothetical protein
MAPWVHTIALEFQNVLFRTFAPSVQVMMVGTLDIMKLVIPLEFQNVLMVGTLDIEKLVLVIIV